MPTVKHTSVRLPIQLYNQVKEAAKRQGISMAEYGRLAMSWYFAMKKAEAAAIRKGRAAYKRGDYITLDQLHDELDTARHQARKKVTHKVS